MSSTEAIDNSASENINGPRRRRSTFYVSLTSDCVKSQKSEPRRTYSILNKKTFADNGASTTQKRSQVSKTNDNPRFHQPRSFRLKTKSPSKENSGSKSSLVKDVTKPTSKPVVTVTKTIETPKSQVPLFTNIDSSHRITSKVKSPLLKVSSGILSSSMQALEALSKSGSETPNKSNASSPLSLIRKSSSRKLSRSSSNIAWSARSMTSGKLGKNDTICSSTSDVSTIIQIDQPPNEELIASYISPSARISDDDDNGVHSDTSYEKACRRGSAPTTPVLGNKSLELAPSKIVNFFSKRSFRSNPLKRTKSVTKLERKRSSDVECLTSSARNKLRTSRSHESLLSGQSSSQSIMQGLDLSCGGVDIKPVHPSVLGKEHCFQVTLPAGNARYFSCRTADERDKWVYSLRKSVQPDQEHMRRTENSLKIWLLEAKGVPNKKKYFCELWLDKTLYAKTSSKQKTDLCFWGEHFEFQTLPAVNVISINLCREGDRKRKRDKSFLVGTVSIPVHEVNSRFLTEKWYPITMDKNLSKDSPALRVKCRFQSFDVLPVHVYQEFLQYLKMDYKAICEILEPVIGVKAKEDIATALVHVMQKEGLAKNFLTDIVMLDIKRVEDARLIFRGNSLATKAMEAFLKLTGERYLTETLGELVSNVLQPGYDCEVDPMKASSPAALARQQQNLRTAVERAWKKILDSNTSFPLELRECFTMFREKLNHSNRQDISDNLISACIFLRFLCPAILSPSLFNITHEYPNEKGARNLTLVAKTLQTLANFTKFQGKENFMEFMNDFLEREASAMKQFLQSISSPLPNGTTKPQTYEFDGFIDLGKQLSILHSLLLECITKVSPVKLKDVDRLHCILERVGIAMNQPSSVHRHFDTSNDSSNYQSLQRNVFRFNDPTVCSNATGSMSTLYSSCARNNGVANHGSLNSTISGKCGMSSGASRSATLPRNAFHPSSTSQLTLRNKEENCGYNPHVVQNGRYTKTSINSTKSLIRPEDYSDECELDNQRKGSQVSISTLSNMASSGYQSFAAYSQTSSPVDLSVQSNNSSNSSSSSNNEAATKRNLLNGHGLPPLAFTNPVYQHKSRKQCHRSCSSSSDENNGDSSDYVSTQRYLHHRVPRTNPQCNVNSRNGLWKSAPVEHKMANHLPVFPSAPVELVSPCLANALEHRLSGDSAHDVTDSSDEGIRNKNHAGKLRAKKNIDQYEQEIERLQSSVDLLKLKLEQAEHQLGDNAEYSPPQPPPQSSQPTETDNMKNIIDRLVSVEEALKQEQRKMSETLTHKQRLIEAQEHQIAMLDATNSQLIAALNELRERFEAQYPSNDVSDMTNRRLLDEFSELKSSSC